MQIHVNNQQTALVFQPWMSQKMCNEYNLTLYQPMTHICVMSSHKPIKIYMGV